MKNALFISNEKYLSDKNEGGVRVCTRDYINLLNHGFNLSVYPVSNTYSFFTRVKKKLGLAVYDDYQESNYKDDLLDTIAQSNIEILFLNQANTIPLILSVKRTLSASIKIILCSHGNESGDFLHESVKFKSSNSWWQKTTSSYLLGKMLKLESSFRQKILDMTLIVSPIEEHIEHWLGAKKSMMIPRTIEYIGCDFQPKLNVVGFVGDLRHWPNKDGLNQICECLARVDHGIIVKIVGQGLETGESLSKKYSFVSYMGYLDNEDVIKEMATWSYFINPLFYFSRGVSTKLSLPLKYGIPVLSTPQSIRGYQWIEGYLPVLKDASEMVAYLVSYAGDLDKILADQVECIKVARSTPAFEDLIGTITSIV